MVLAILGVVANAADLNVAQGVVAPDKPASLNVQLSSGTDTITGIQFDVQYDAAALDLSVQAGPTVGPAGKGLQSAAIGAGKLRVLVFGFNKNVIPDGVVAILRVSLKGPVEADKSFPVHISAQSGTNARAETVAVAGHDGGVKVK